MVHPPVRSASEVDRASTARMVRRLLRGPVTRVPVDRWVPVDLVGRTGPVDPVVLEDRTGPVDLEDPVGRTDPVGPVDLVGRTGPVGPVVLAGRPRLLPVGGRRPPT